MKFLISTVLIAVCSLVMQLVLPWWSILLAAFAIGMIVPLPGMRSFLSGLLGIAIVWWGYALVIDAYTDSILSEKIAVMFKVGSPWVLILIGGLLAGLVGGFAAASGSALRKSAG